MGSMKANRKFIEEDEAVSAVIGVILMVAITVAIAATVYYYVTSLTSTEGGSAPTLAYNVNAAADTITVTKCTPSTTKYAAATDSANLIFKNSTGISYYVLDDLTISTAGTGYETANPIQAGDIIRGFVDGESYTIVWDPLNEVLGSFTI